MPAVVDKTTHRPARAGQSDFRKRCGHNIQHHHDVQIGRIAVVMACAAHCFQTYRSRIPNGDRVRNPCDQSVWSGVGHWDPKGHSPTNPFGTDFAAENHMWTVNLCRKDSDGDGNTNGFELGDPNCRWTPGSLNVGSVQGHPGVCEPVHSPQCEGNNLYLPC